MHCEAACRTGVGHADCRRFGSARPLCPVNEPDAPTPVHPADQDGPSTRQEEWRSFVFLTVVTAPVLAVAVVGGWGFVVWMYQLLTGDLPG